jgi:MFS family permease
VLKETSSLFLTKAAVISVACMFGLTYSLSATLIALNLASMGLSETLIGANAAMHAVGVLAMVFILPRLSVFFGLRPVVLFSLLLSAFLLFLFPALPFYLLWFPLRVLLGAASEALFVLSETWLNELSSEATRGRTMGAYTASLSAGFALGPLILSIIGAEGFAPYLTGTCLSVLAAVLIMMPGVRAPALTKPTHDNPMAYLKLAPLSLAATALNASVETAGLTFLALYALSLGWAENQATGLMSIMMIGAIALQVPIGWLADKIDRQRLVGILAGLSALGALIWPLVLQSQAATYAILFVWGGAFVGIYTIMLAIVGSRFKGGDLVGIYATMGLMWGGGALLGPLLAGLSMQITLHGLPWFIAAICFAFMVMTFRLRT